MKTRWATRTSELFWTNPVLWVPVFLASLLSLFVQQFQALLVRRLLMTFLWQKESVFSSATAPPSRNASTLMHASMIGAPVYWGALFLCTVFYVCAFLLTAVLVRNLLRRPLPDASPISALLRSRLDPILRCSVIFWGLYALEALLSSVTANGLSVLGGKPLLQYWIYFAFALNAVLAWIAASFAYGFLERSGFGKASPAARRQGRLFAALAALLSPLIGFLYARATATVPALHENGTAAFAVTTAGSLLTVIPYILLMIFFAVSTEEQRPVAEEEAPATSYTKQD